MNYIFYLTFITFEWGIFSPEAHLKTRPWDPALGKLVSRAKKWVRKLEMTMKIYKKRKILSGCAAGILTASKITTHILSTAARCGSATFIAATAKPILTVGVLVSVVGVIANHFQVNLNKKLKYQSFFWKIVFFQNYSPGNYRRK